jgi:hypothetical protein
MSNIIHSIFFVWFTRVGLFSFAYQLDNLLSNPEV